MSGSGIRPRWGRLFERGNRAGVDFSVSPVHEVADDVPVEPPPTGGPPPVDVVVTGITSEFSTSELVFTETGDSIVVEGT